MIWYKQGVCGDLQPVARKALGMVAEVAENNGEDVFVTSIADGNHMLGSLHFSSLAWDMRKLRSLDVGALRALLGDDFDVVAERDHIHIEYDP